MGTFFNHAEAMIRTLTRVVGEDIQIIAQEDGTTHQTLAIYENYYYEMQDGGVPVQVDTPSFLIRNKDITFTSQFPLNRKEWKIKRLATGVTYIITDYERDEAAAVRYLIAEEESQDG